MMNHGIEGAQETGSRNVAERQSNDDTNPALIQQPSSPAIARREHNSSNFRHRHNSDSIHERRRKDIRASSNASSLRRRQLSLQPVVSAARSDPFNCWPVAWHRDLDENFRFLVRGFGPSTFGYVENDQGFDIFQRQARLALTDPAAFHSLMIISTTRKGQLAGRTLPSVSALWHKVEALRLVKDRIDGGDMDQCTSEGTIYAVMVLMGIASMWKAVDKDEFDTSALNRLILHKGGLNVVSKLHPVLEISLFGVAVMNPGLLRSDLYAVNELSAFDRKQDARTLLYGLLGFLRGISGLVDKTPVTLSRVQRMFGPGTVSYSLLAFTPNHPGIRDDHQARLQRRLHQHVVLYVFSVLLWASPFQVEHFINHLHYIMGHAEIWRHSLRMFAWALVADVPKGSLLYPPQAWQSYEILCAVHCLDENLQGEFLRYCLDLLIGRNEVATAGAGLASRIRSVMFKQSIDAVESF